MDRRQCVLFPTPLHPPTKQLHPAPVAEGRGGGSSNNVEARLDCSDWGHWLWWFDLLISPPLLSNVASEMSGLIWVSYGKSCASQRMGGDKECMKGNYTYLNHTPVPALPVAAAPMRGCQCTCVCASACARPLFCARPCVQVCVFFFLRRCANAGGGCEAVQSPGRTEWIYKLMEFKASSIDYHYNKQQHTECLIIFRQRFCALSSNSADAVTLSDICLWLQLDGIQKEK